MNEHYNADKSAIKCIFCCMAPAEMSFSLRVLANPSEYPQYSNWAKLKFDSLSSNLKQEIDFFNTRYQWYFITDVVVHLMGEEETSVDNINILLERMNKIDDITFAYIFLGFSAHNYGYDKLNEWISNPDILMIEDMGPQGEYFQIEDVRYFLKNVNSIKNRIINLYKQYWTELFHKEWLSIREFEENAIRFQRIKYQHLGLIDYLNSLHNDLVIEDNLLSFKNNKAIQIDMQKLKFIVIKPSIFVGVNADFFLTQNAGEN